MVRRWSAYCATTLADLRHSPMPVRLRGDTSVGRRPLASAASPSVSQKLTFAPLCCRPLLACVCEGQSMFQLDRRLLSSRTNRAV